MGRSKDLIILNQAMRMNIYVSNKEFTGNVLDLAKIQKEIAEKRPRCGCSKKRIIEGN